MEGGHVLDERLDELQQAILHTQFGKASATYVQGEDPHVWVSVLQSLGNCRGDGRAQGGGQVQAVADVEDQRPVGLDQRVAGRRAHEFFDVIVGRSEFKRHGGLSKCELVAKTRVSEFYEYLEISTL